MHHCSLSGTRLVTIGTVFRSPCGTVRRGPLGIAGKSLIRSVRVGLRGLACSLALLLAEACCETPKFSVGDLKADARFSLNVSLDIDFDVDTELDFHGDLAAWSKLGAVTAASLSVDLDGLKAYQRLVRVDIDDDGVAEAVSYLAFGSAPRAIEHGFARWEGDKYTFNKGACYLLSWHGDEATLVSARCDSDGAALFCSIDSAGSDDVSCEVCDGAGECAACDRRSVADCIKQGEETLMTTVGGGSSVDAGGGGAIDVDGSVALDTCVSEVNSLGKSGADCGIADNLDRGALCENSQSDVHSCFLALEAASLFNSACDVINTGACAGVF